MMNIFDLIVRYLFFRGGHRIHSPFVFKLITDVVEDRYKYYFYEQLPYAYHGISPDQQKLLFRLALYFKPVNFSIHSCGDACIRNCIQTAYPLALEINALEQLSKTAHWNMFVWTLPNDTVNLSKLNDKNRLILVCRNIRKKGGASRQWKELKNHPLRKTALDLGQIGLLFFDSKLNREEYKNYF